MQLHPGKKIQEELKDRGWTQRQFAFLLWKKVSEVNELIKWKRNITVQRDILLSHVLWTSRKYRLDLQNEYEYYLVESDFDKSKLPNLDQKIHTFSEQNGALQKVEENSKKLQKIEINQNSKTFDSNNKIVASEWQELEKKEEKTASHHYYNLNKDDKIDKDVDTSIKQKKHPKFDQQKIAGDSKTLQKVEKNSKNLQKIEKPHPLLNQDLIQLDSSSKIITQEWQVKKDKYEIQKIYNHNDKFDSYFSPKEKINKNWSKSINVDQHWKNKTKIIPQKQDSLHSDSGNNDSPLIKGDRLELPKKNQWNIEIWSETESSKAGMKHWNNIHKQKEHIFRNF